MAGKGTRRRDSGRLGPFLEGYRVCLVAAGYAPGTVEHRLEEAAGLGRWMQCEDVLPESLNVAAIQRFRMDLVSSGRSYVPGVRRFAALLEYLRGQGVLVEAPVVLAPVQGLLADYRRWLVQERGLAPLTVLRYERAAARFLSGHCGHQDIHAVASLTGASVSAFLLKEAGRVSVGVVKGRVAELRSLLRFLYLAGHLPVPLADAVPPVAGWRDTSLPATLSAGDVQRLVDSCDRSSPSGMRDYAILLLLARLGLRSGEVAALELDDIDWRAGQIMIRGKGRRRDTLPLPADVGEAVAGYLSTARPVSELRTVLLTCQAPVRGIAPARVSDVVRRACCRAGLPIMGAHRLRHGLASELLARGATLVEVSQVLRHQDLATTAIYAKVDLNRLRELVQPWPGALR